MNSQGGWTCRQVGVQWSRQAVPRVRGMRSASGASCATGTWQETATNGASLPSHLDISVDVVVLVDVLEALEDLPDDRGDRCLLQALGVAVLHDMEYRAAGDVRHDHPQVLPVDERTVQRQDVGVVVQAHGLGLVDDLVLRHSGAAHSVKITCENEL